MTEFDIQKLLIAWFRKNYKNIPCFAIPNGEIRDKVTAARLKQSGTLAGIPDLLIADGSPGLFLEVKKNNGKLSLNQKVVIAQLKEQGYTVEVCYSYEQGKEIILNYLNKHKY